MINASKVLLFPVLWHEPFGIAITESLYFGCPVFGTPYGSLPELVTPAVGFLSNSYSALSEALKEIDSYDRNVCHEYVCDQHTSKEMTKKYLEYYEKVLNGETINRERPRNPLTEDVRHLPMVD